MAQSSRRQVRLSRSLGVALTPKAARYFEKRPYGPGQHGRARRRQDSDYAVRLKEKQRLRAQYGLREAQMRRAFEEALRMEGITGYVPVLLAPLRRPASSWCTVTSSLMERSLTVLRSA